MNACHSQKKVQQLDCRLSMLQVGETKGATIATIHNCLPVAMSNCHRIPFVSQENPELVT